MNKLKFKDIKTSSGRYNLAYIMAAAIATTPTKAPATFLEPAPSNDVTLAGATLDGERLLGKVVVTTTSVVS